MVKQLDQLGMKVPHVASGALCIAFLRKLVTPDEIAGHYCEAPDVLPPSNERPQVQAFVGDLHEDHWLPARCLSGALL